MLIFKAIRGCQSSQEQTQQESVNYMRNQLPAFRHQRAWGRRKKLGCVTLTLDKLSGIRADLVRLDDDWQEWGFPQLVGCERNPVPLDSYRGGGSWRHDRGNDKALQTKQGDWKPKPCVYCKSGEHKSVDCDKIKEVADRRKYLSNKKLCFNCTRTKH